MILSGAEIPYLSPIQYSSGPPLLAIQGTADTIKPPPLTYTFYDAAPAPKYLVKLLGAPHLPPYTHISPSSGSSSGFAPRSSPLSRRLTDALKRMVAAASVPGTATISADPPVR